MQYNLLLYGAAQSGCTPTAASVKNTYLSTIVNAIRPDIFGANEMGENSLYADNILVNVLKPINPAYARTTYTNATGSNVSNHLWYNSDKLGLAGEHAIPHFLRDINYYKLYYKDPLLGTVPDTAFIHVVIVHYKAYSSSADGLTQASQGWAIMNYLESLGVPGNYIVMGDFNINASTDSSYKVLIQHANQDVRMYDPISSGGTWGNNSSYAGIHTQSTRSSSSSDCGSGGGMDDRFDQILISGYIKGDSASIKYIPGTYKAYGNDGIHYNNNINGPPSNTAVSTTIANALYSMSDHLPVIMELAVTNIATSTLERSVTPFSVNIQENPFEEQISLNVSGISGQLLNVAVYDLSGHLISEKTVHLTNNKTNVQLPAIHIPSGFYFLKVKNEVGQIVIKKLIKR